MKFEDVVRDAEYGLVKYVRVASEIRFCSLYADHDRLLNRAEAYGDTPLSAGFINFDTDKHGKKYFSIPDDWSSTLQIGPNKDKDGPKIAEITGMTYIVKE